MADYTRLLGRNNAEKRPNTLIESFTSPRGDGYTPELLSSVWPDVGIETSFSDKTQVDFGLFFG